MWTCPNAPSAIATTSGILCSGERLTMVKEIGQLPGLPRGVPADAAHATANAVHSAALRLLRRARTADVGMDLDGPRASALSVLVFGRSEERRVGKGGRRRWVPG